MKWLHISDLHLNLKDDGTDSVYMRDCLINFMKKRDLELDKIFITGDFRDASKQKDINVDEYIKDITDYILNLAQSVGISSTKNILIVPGNHDLMRYHSERQQIITDTKNNYDPSVGIIKNLDILIDSFNIYKKVLINICGEKEAKERFENFKINPHELLIEEGYNILQLNTDLIAGHTININGKDTTTDDNLVIGSRYILHSLVNANKNNPTMVIAHRDFELFKPEERRKLINIFQDNNICLYSCGHSHNLWYDEPYGIPQITMGCLKQDKNVKPGFSLNELNLDNMTITIGAYSWDNDCWAEYSHIDRKRKGHPLIIDISNKILLDGSKYNKKIKMVINGEVREFYCGDIKTEHSLDKSSTITTTDGKLFCSVLNNKYSELISVGNTFPMSKSKWEVIATDDYLSGITKLTCVKKEYNKEFDDFQNGIMDTQKISDFSIDLLTSVKFISINQKFKITPMFFRDKKHVEDIEFKYEVSDENIVKIENGFLHGIAAGETFIKIMQFDNTSRFLELRINVTETNVGDIVTYRFYKLGAVSAKKQYKDIDIKTGLEAFYGIDKFVNGNLVENDETYNFYIKKSEFSELVEIIEYYNTYVKISVEGMKSGFPVILIAENRESGKRWTLEFEVQSLF